MDSGDERYERRRVEETSKLRVELAGVEMRLTERIAQTESTLREELSDLGSALRQEMSDLGVALRQESASLEVRMERGFGTLRADIIKWAFLFWLGEVAAMTAIMSAMLR